MHIILLDDHELFAKSLEFLLKSSVSKFESFTSIEKLFCALEEKVPDILLLDINLENQNGLDVGVQLLELYPEIKIIFLSGYDLVEYHNQAITMGAKGFVNKNTSVPELLKIINLVQQGMTIFPEHDNELEPLTDREKEILQLAASGLKQQEIAEQLHISRRTVNTHIQSILIKFKVSSTISAIIRGIELGIVSVSI